MTSAAPAPATGLDDGEALDHGRRPAHPPRDIVPTALWITGTVLLAGAPVLADAIGYVLPNRAKISSVGTAVDRFEDTAPAILRRTGFVLLAAAGVATFSRLRPGRPRWLTDSSGRIAAGFVTIATGLWYGWLAEPHNGFATNARFHWVDYLTFNSDNYVYVAGRLPHFVFYEHPYVWQGINAALLSWLCYAVARRLGFSTWLATLLATLPATAGNLLLFAGSAEDVILNVTLLLGVVWAMLVRRPIIVGLAISLASLGRPTFLVLAACVVIAEATVGIRRSTTGPRVDQRYLALVLSTVAAFTLVSQVLYSILGQRHFLTRGALVYNEGLGQWRPRSIEGFTISPFSGVYVTHLLWMMPAALLVGTVAALFTARGQSRAVAATIYASACFVVAHVAAHEAKPLSYYNSRYLAYVIPMLAVCAWAILAHQRAPRSGPRRNAYIAVIVLGVTVFPARPIEQKRWVEERPATALLPFRDQLSELADGRDVYLDFGDVLSRNYVSYVLRKPFPDVLLITEDTAVPSSSLVISKRDEPWESGDVVATVGDFVVSVVSPTELDG